MSYVSTHPRPLPLGDGRFVEAGPVTRVDPKDPLNARHIKSGRLIEVKPKSKPQKESK